MKEILERLWPWLRRKFIEAMAGFVFWTIALTPVMFFYVKASPQQYWKWVFGSQLLFSPILSAASVWFINWVKKISIPESKTKKELRWPE